MNEKIKSILKVAPIELGKHLRGDEGWLRYHVETALTTRLQDEAISRGEWTMLIGGVECSECGIRLNFWTNGVVVRLGEEGEPDFRECEYASGVPDIVFRIPILSGKMVVANDLRELYPLERSSVGEWSVNHFPGSRRWTLAYAELGMAHCFVSNSSPEVYRVSSDKFLIGRGANEDEETEDILAGYPVVADVTTDLWWYSICDYASYEERASLEFKAAAEKWRLIQIVDCDPGVYEFRHKFWGKPEMAEGVYTEVSRR